MVRRTRGRQLHWLLTAALVAVAVAVPGAGPASAATDPVAGSWNVTYGAPAVVTMTLANGVYTETASTPVRVVGAACDLPAGTVIATFSASGPLTYVGQHGLWSVANCSFAFFTPITLTLSADGATLLSRLGDGETFSFTRSRIWHWPGHGFVHTRFRRNPAVLPSPGGDERTEHTAPNRAARLAVEATAPRRPACTDAAVHRAIARQEHPRYQWALSGLQCAGRYAVVALEDLTDQAQFTRLLHWTNTNRWRVIDRIRACAQRRVPLRIRTLTCQSN